mgnify:CR=1 FL=1|jgi:hypothetical protein|tara:strand:+ start:98 stop:541 length:444 start_codon:yes stop_codon:yes gene_type:complete
MVDAPVHTNLQQKHQFDSQELVLGHYAKIGNMTQACKMAGVGRTTAFEWQTRDAQGFRDRYDKAREAYADSLEKLMHERLSDPTGNRGSDILLMFNLKARRPEVYGDKVTVQDDTSRDMLSILRARPGSRVEVIEGTAKELPPATDD